METQLQEWRQWLTTISRNVMDLSEAPSTKRIAAKSRAGYTGLTLQRATEALKCVEDLWLDYLLLARVVEDASDLAMKDGFFRKTEAEVLELLNGESIELPTVHVSLPSRELLTDHIHGKRTSPALVLQAMQQHFVRARDLFVRIEDAETNMEKRMSALSLGVEEAEQRAKASDLPALALRVGQCPVERIQHDPLGCAEEVGRVEAELRRHLVLIESAEAERVQLCDALCTARGNLTKLKELIAAGHAARAEAHLKIAEVDIVTELMNEDEVIPLEEWLTKLDATAADGRWSSLGVGLQRWTHAYESKLSRAQDALTPHRRLLDERADLRGRFQAFGAKIKKLEMLGQPPDAALKKLMAEAQAALEARPFHMASARNSVRAFEDRFLRRRR